MLCVKIFHTFIAGGWTGQKEQLPWIPKIRDPSHYRELKLYLYII